LLHTLRTQLDIFQKIIPELAKTFTVYTLDYPGHGWSDIPATDYTPAFFVDIVGKFLDEQRIGNATLAGVSIGGTIPLLLAAHRHSAVARVVAINSYDYAKGRGITRANLVAWLIFTLARIPVLGETVMRFRNPLVERKVLEGGVADPDALPESFLRETYAVGCRRGHYRAFLNLIRNAYKWEEARSEYGKISVPVLVVYGDQDWSRESERRATLERIPGAKLEVVKNGGHFLSLDCPQDIIRLIREFTNV
jgi:pimeloyl-ACP methyl ester carboxylesterase